MHSQVNIRRQQDTTVIVPPFPHNVGQEGSQKGYDAYRVVELQAGQQGQEQRRAGRRASSPSIQGSLLA